MSNLWERKLLAFLHDPPSKPFNLAEHRAIAARLLEQAGFKRVPFAAAFFDKVCDHTAAAADRIVCPKSSAMHAEWQRHEAFKHPLGGGTLNFEQVITPSQAESRVEAEQPQAGEFDFSKVADARLGENQTRPGADWARFFLHWRLWPSRCAEREPSLVHLPADTRIPDHTIWTHCSLVSALQACVEVVEEGDEIGVREFKPAFLLVQIGPVQEFIGQARPTRDLWSGSFLLSWLIAHGIKAVTDRVGPDCVLFPALRSQPLFDFLHRAELYEPLGCWNQLRHSAQRILTPNLPNRFLAIVPAWQAVELASAAETAMRGESGELCAGISEACLKWLDDQGHRVEPAALTRWRQQVRQFLTVHWQVWPWEANVSKAIRRFSTLPLGGKASMAGARTPAEALRLAYDGAREGIPHRDLDARNYKHRSWREGDVWKSEVIPGADGLPEIDNPGFAWAAHYAQTEFLLAARRNTRDFERWGVIPGVSAEDQNQADDSRQGATKDVLSGKEESIGSRQWQDGLASLPGHLFKEGERLGAINILKRIWHLAYLEAQHGLKRSRVFDSVPAVAAAAWRRGLIGKMREHEAVWLDFLGFATRAVAASHLGYLNIPNAAPDVSGRLDEGKWLDGVDASVFHRNEWQRAIRDEAARKGGPREGAIEALTGALDSLSRLQRPKGEGGLVGGQPLPYVAILAMDGDSMGEWISGAKSPVWREQLAKEAIEYFDRSPGVLRQVLAAPRHVSPSYHLQFSGALANFSLHLAAAIVEFFDGQLIYSGGDDVLAMLPAERALGCAQALRMAFRGDPGLSKVFPGALRAKDDAWGFVALDGGWEGWSRLQRASLPRGYQLIVPGKNADISAGIAIGHMHTPLQNLVEAARQAEKDAKRDTEQGGYGKSAFAVHLYKRSGEVVRWGAKWGDSAIEVADCFSQLTEERKLSGRFTYALARNVRFYEATPHPNLDASQRSFRIGPVDGFDAETVLLQEFASVLRKQSDQQWLQDHSEEAASFRALAARYLGSCAGRRLDDFLGPFLTTTFIHKGAD